MNKVPADTPVERAREALEEALRGLGDGKSEAIERVRFAHAILAGLDEYLAAHSTPATPEVLELCHRTTLIDWEELNARRVTQVGRRRGRGRRADAGLVCLRAHV